MELCGYYCSVKTSDVSVGEGWGTLSNVPLLVSLFVCVCVCGVSE